MPSRVRNKIVKNWVLYLFLTPAVVYMLLFAYQPMYGVIIAFKDYTPRVGVAGSAWVGLAHFKRLLSMYNFGAIFRNTLTLSLYSLMLFPLPVILALMLNCCRSSRIKKCAQVVTYMPHFVSTVVVVSMIDVIFAPRMGVVSQLLSRWGLLDGYLDVLTNARAFSHLYTWSGVWQGLGWGSIVYVAALSGVDVCLYEAATIDGAGRMQRIWHVDIPCILPTIAIMFILRMGSVMSVGYEKVYLMQNPLNISASEIISTYVYKQGIIKSQYSFSTAVGLFNSAVNVALLITFNALSKKLTESSLF